MKIRKIVPVFLLICGIGLLLITALSGFSTADPTHVDPTPVDPNQPISPEAPPAPPGNDISDFTGPSGLILTAAGCILIVVNFARSVSSTAPESRAMQIQMYVEEHPGSSESDIVKYLGYSRGSTAHHLKRLVRETRVAEKSYRNTVRYYPPVIQTAEEDTLNAVISKEKPAIILEALGNYALTMSELLEKTGLSVSSLRWHLARMEEDGVIVSEKSGKLVIYSVRR